MVDGAGEAGRLAPAGIFALDELVAQQRLVGFPAVIVGVSLPAAGSIANKDRDRLPRRQHIGAAIRRRPAWERAARNLLSTSPPRTRICCSPQAPAKLPHSSRQCILWPQHLPEHRLQHAPAGSNPALACSPAARRAPRGRSHPVLSSRQKPLQHAPYSAAGVLRGQF